MTEIPKKVIVVSGAAGYVGTEVARRLLADGYGVAALYRESAPQYGRAYQCDLRDAAAVAAVLDQIEEEWGPVYGCVHAAASLPIPKQLHMVSSLEFQETVEADVYSSFNFLSDCARRFKLHGQGILIGITTAGVAASKNTKARGVYSVIKFALQGMLVAFHEELAPRGVRVYSIAPGVMEGGLNKQTPKAFLDMVRVLIPDKTLMSAEKLSEKISALIANTAQEAMTVRMAPESE